MRRKLATTAVVAAVGLTGAALLAPAIASADPAAGTGRVGMLRQALEQLVSDGTLNDAQADKVADRLSEVAAPLGHGPGRMGRGPATPQAIADALGMTVQELHEARRAGKTLAQVAQEQGVAKADLVTELVAAATARIDKAVADGRLSSEQAAERKAGLRERITAFVDATPHEPGMGRGMGRGSGQGHRQGPPPIEETPAD